VGKKRLKRELRALAERQAELDREYRRLVAHCEVIAVAVRSPDLVPRADLDDAIAGIHELNASLESRSFPGADLHAGQEHFGPSH
jgi:hypothetical protein